MALTKTRGAEIEAEAAIRTRQLEEAIVHVAALRHHLADLDRECVQLSQHGLWSPSITGAVEAAEERAAVVVAELKRGREVPDMPNAVKAAEYLPTVAARSSR